jgi:predicted transposase/invertase (TIGR01784 family)
MRFADIKNDVALGKIFANKKKTICLISFLNAILGFEGNNRLAKVTWIAPYLLPRIRGEKASIIDVRATDMRGRQFIVEMQVADKKGFAKRVQYYTAKDYSLQLLAGEDYQLLNPTYFIGILNFPFGTNTSYYTKHLTTDQETGEHLLADMQYAFIQLTKFKKKESELVTIVDKWTYFLKNARKLKLVPGNTDDEGLKEAYEEAEMFNWSKDTLMAYTAAGMREHDARNELEKAKDDGKEEGRVEGIEIGMEKGVEEGKKNEKLNVARNLLVEGATVALVSKVTGLSIEEVQKIVDELAQK